MLRQTSRFLSEATLVDKGVLCNVIGKAGSLRAHKDENVKKSVVYKSVGQGNRRGVNNIIDIFKLMEMDKIT